MTHILHFRTDDHPEAAGRKPVVGEQAWTFRCRLEDGSELRLHMGRTGRDTFRGFLLREEMDDAADEAQAALNE